MSEQNRSQKKRKKLRLEVLLSRCRDDVETGKERKRTTEPAERNQGVKRGGGRWGVAGGERSAFGHNQREDTETRGRKDSVTKRESWSLSSSCD